MGKGRRSIPVVVDVARRARWRALVVPLLMSAALWVVTGALLVTISGWPALLAPAALVSASGVLRAGEWWVARGLLLARAPRLHQRHTLAAVAQVLRGHGAGVPGLVLLVGPGSEVAVTAFGRRTVVVTRGLVDAVASGRLAPVTAASLIAPEVGVVRAGLTRGEVALTLFLLPWSVWLTFVLALWQAVAAFLPRRLMVACLVLNGAVGLWLGMTVHPAHHVAAAFVGVALWAWWAMRSWLRARDRVGDAYLAGVGLARPYADWLLAAYGDDHARDRAVRLTHPHVLAAPPPASQPPAQEVLPCVTR